jgi:hypothetical protein
MQGSPLELDDMAVLTDHEAVLGDGGLADLLFDTGTSRNRNPETCMN